MPDVALPVFKPARALSAPDMACLVFESDHVLLPGYKGPSAISPWKKSSFAVVQADLSESEIIHELRQQGRSNRLTWLLVCFFILAGLAMSAVSVVIADHREIPLAPIEWKVSGVDDDGLTIQSGETRIHVGIGARMPNGDTLLATSQTTQSYTTDVGITKMAK